MSRLGFIILALTLLLASACTPSRGAAPAPTIIVVTATPAGAAASPSPASAEPSRTVGPTLEIVATADPDAANLKATDIKYILAKEDINIRSGPGTSFDIVGGIYAGQTAQVTGYMSQDGKWWRVVCPTNKVEHCWVSADPALTEPTTPPTPAPQTTQTL